MKTSIIIPTYNERGNIEKLVSELFGACKGYDVELVIVDDNSPDGTGELAEKLSKKHNITVVHRAGKLGLSTAVVAGFEAAKGDILGVMDADLSHPPNAIPSMFRPIIEGKADLVVGSRYANGGGVEVWPFTRRMISLGATMLARPLTKVRDPMSGLFFMRKEVIQGVDFRAQGYKIGLEIIVKGNYKRVTEVPYIFRNRTVGKSKLSIKEDYYYLKNLVKFYSYGFMHPKNRTYVQWQRTSDEIYTEQDPRHYYRALIKGNKVQKFWHKYKFLKAVRDSRVRNGESILDCGSGSGTLLLFLPQKTKATAMDISKANVEFSKKIRPGAKGITGSIITKIPGKEKYDVIFLIEVIEHLPKPEQHHVLRNIYAALKPGGRLVLTTPNYRSIWPIIEKIWSKLNPVDYNEQHINKYNPTTITRVLAEAGFGPIKTSTFFFIAPFLAVISEKLARAALGAEYSLAPGIGQLIICAAEKPIK
jgi:glycosyltransferase involved in cell wall biosynthesis